MCVLLCVLHKICRKRCGGEVSLPQHLDLSLIAKRMEELPPDVMAVLASIKSLKASVAAASNTCSQFLNHDAESVAEFEALLTPTESAKFSISTAYTILSLYYALLRARVRCCALHYMNIMTFIIQGKSQQAHPIKKELDRIKVYMEKLKAAENISAGTPPLNRPPTDASTANRIVSHHIKSSVRTEEQGQPTEHTQKKRKKQL